MDLQVQAGDREVVAVGPFDLLAHHCGWLRHAANLPEHGAGAAAQVTLVA
jgi:hypothetical protein